MTAVVFGREDFAAAELLTGLVEEAVGVAPGVAEPSGKLAYGTLREELDTIGPAFAQADFLFPTHRATTEEGGAILVLHEVVHTLVVAFQGEVADVLDVVEQAGGDLMGVHGRDLGRYGNPEVGGEGDGAVAQEVEILGGVGVAGFDGEVVGEEETGAETGLERGIEGALDVEAAEDQTGVDLEGGRDAPVVLDIGVDLVGVDDTLAEGGVEGIVVGDA